MVAPATEQPKERESYVRPPLIRTFGLLTAVVIAVLAAGTASSAANAAPAQDDDNINIVGVLLDNRTTPKTPVEGVKITVLDDQGNVVGDDLSGKDGRFKIP